MFDAAARRAIARTARDLGVEPAALLAVAEVESGGRAHAPVAGRDEPLIRFEGHYFHRLLRGRARARAVADGLASPRAGAVRNPRTQAARWAMLARARAIDSDAADQSVSWGLGQVMGANWRALGYASVGALVREARSGTGGQVALMARFVRANGLTGALRRRDWRAFARAYNGPGYAKHGYHTRMARAYRRWVRAGANAPDASEPAARPERTAPSRWDTASPPTLRRGDRGEGVARLQGVVGVRADGLFGPLTDAALRRFQRRRGLVPDGVVGPRTWAAIEQNAQRARMRSAIARIALAPFRWAARTITRMLSTA